MNTMIISLLIVLILLLFILIVVLAILGNRFLKIKESQVNISQNTDSSKVDSQTDKQKTKVEKRKVSPEILEALRSKGVDKSQINSVYCNDHPDVYSNGKCSISLEPLCEQCLSKQGEILVGRKYLDLFLESEWEELFMIKQDKDVKDRFLKTKKELWENDQLPVIIQGHYKINVQDDNIEEYIVVLARPEDKDVVKRSFKWH